MNAKQYMNRVAELGCIICGSPAEIHHLRTGAGMGQRGNEVIPLCPFHHRQGPFGEAIHSGAKEFAKKHGDERTLLDKLNRILEL